MLGRLGLPGHSKGVHSTACWDRPPRRVSACRSPRRTAATERCAMSSPSIVQPYRFFLFASLLTDYHEESADVDSTGLRSTTGVPSIASIGPTLTLVPAISRTVTRCRPNGLGRSGDRVAKTPVRGLAWSLRGCVFKI